MKRSLSVGWMNVALVSIVFGCGQAELAPVEPVPSPPVAARHDEVTLATTATPPAVRPPPAIEPARAETRPGRRAELTLRRLVVATDVVDHEPVGASDVIDADEERVYAFLDVESPGEAETLVVTFASDDGARVVGHVEVAVPAHTARWRTWVFSRHLSPGLWHAEVHGADGRLIDDRAFEVR